MLRKLINFLLPKKEVIFFDLFINAAENTHKAAEILAKILNNRDQAYDALLSAKLRNLRYSAVEINKNVLIELNKHFITTLERSDIQELSVLLLKLTKKIVKINQKLKVYEINADTDKSLIQAAINLCNITKIVVNITMALKNGNHEAIANNNHQSQELDETIIEDLNHAMRLVHLSQTDAVTIIKLKEVYKSIEAAVDTSINLVELVMQISLKDM